MIIKERLTRKIKRKRIKENPRTKIRLWNAFNATKKGILRKIVKEKKPKQNVQNGDAAVVENERYESVDVLITSNVN